MTRRSWWAAALLALACAGLAGCNRSEAAPREGELAWARRTADMVQAALAADRAVYAEDILQRLTMVQKIQVVDPESGEARPLEGREDWKSEHGKLPLPAQVLRMGAERVLMSESGLSYVLLSPWPINKQNRARTAEETRGLDRVVGSRKPHYGTEVLDGKTYFVAIYPDVAVSEACVTCHNQHRDSPRRDFKVDDVMGGLVIRFPL